MGHFWEKYKTQWRQHRFGWSSLGALVLFAISLVANYWATRYAALAQSNPVTDIILNLIPAQNVDWILIEGALVVIGVIIGIMAYEPKSIPFVLKSVSLFILVRSLAMILTHIAPFPVRTPNMSGVLLKDLGLTNTADLFFSGHTGLPFLMALIFWHYKYIRIGFLCTSVIFAVSVLVGHLHYTIDVFAAYFITYTIFHIAQKIFAKDYRNFLAIS